MKAGEWTLRSRRVVTPSGTRAADVLIRDETIVKLLDHDGPETEGVVLDAGDLAVLPGLVALHRERCPGLEDRWLEAVTRDAAAGGVTTLIDLPPGLDDRTPDESEPFRRLTASEGIIRVDCGMVVPLGHRKVDRVEAWIEAGFLGVEAMLGDSLSDNPLRSTESDLRAAMPILADLGRPLLVDLGQIARPSRGPDESGRFGSSLPEREFAAIKLLIRLARETRCRVHLIHPSGSEALPMIADARAQKLPVTVETCPGHLGVPFSTNPDDVATFPLDRAARGNDARNRLWDGLESGLIDAIGPGVIRPVADPSASSSGGGAPARVEASPLTLALPAVWAEAKRRGFTLEQLGRWLAGRTAGVMGLQNRKGSIAPGFDADLVVFDPDGTPDGRPMVGQIEATILRGTMIYQSGRFCEHPRGAVVLRFEETEPIPGTDA